MKHSEHIRPLFHTAKIAAILLLAQVTLHTASANDLTWDTDGATVTDGSGTWSNGGGNWYDGTAATWSNSDPDTAFIGVGGTAGTVTITGAGGVTAAGITFNPVASGTYIITGASLTLSPSSTITVNSVAATIDSAIIGNNTQSITTEGSGTLYMTGTSDNTSLGVIVGGGTLVLAKSSSPSVFAIGGPGLTVDFGATLQLGGTTGNDQIYEGAVGVVVNSGGVFDMNGRNQTLDSDINLQGTGIGGNGALINSSGSLSTLNSTVYLSEAATVGGVGDITINGNVIDNILTKVSADTLTLTGVGDNSGLSLAVNAGTVVLAKSSSASVWAAGGATVDSGGTLQLGGTTGFDQFYEGSTTIFVSAGGVFDMNGRNQTLNNGMNIAGSGAGSGALVNSSLTPSTLTGGITFSGTGGAIGGIGDITVNGEVQSSTLTVLGPGTVTLTGSTGNTSLGAIVAGGTLVLAKEGNSSGLAIGGPGVTVDSGGTLQLGGTTGNDQIYDGAISGAGGDAILVNSGGVFDMNGENQTLDNDVNLQGSGIGGAGALINSSGSLSTLTSTVYLANPTTVGGIGNITISGRVIDSLLTKVGANTLTLAGGGDNTGLGLLVNAGTVVLAKSTTGSNWAAGGIIEVSSGGLLQLGGSTGFDQIYEGAPTAYVDAGGVFDMNGQNQTLNNGINIAGSGTGAGALVNNSLTTSTLTGGITFSGTGGAIGGIGPIIVNGEVQSGTLTKLGSGTATLSGGSDDTSLVVVVDAGTLVLAKTSSGSVFAVGGGGATVNGGTLQLGGSTGNDQIYDFATNLTVNSGGAFDMNGRNQTLTNTTPFDLAGALVNNNASTLSTLNANIVLTGSASIGGLGNLAIPDSISESGGSQSLTKVGSGTVTLSGPASSYSGATYVNGGLLTVAGSLSNTASGWAAFGGTLEVDGVLNPTATTTADGGTLQGNGTVGAITVDSVSQVDPGLDSLSSSAGNLTANGNLLLTDSTSLFSIRLGVATAADNDELTMDSGNVTLDNATLKLTMSGNYANQAIGFIYVIINGQPAGSTITGEFEQGTSIIANQELFDIVYGENATDTGSGHDVLLIAEGYAIPEPGTWGMFMGAAAMLLAFQRASAKRPGKIRRVPITGAAAKD